MDRRGSVLPPSTLPSSRLDQLLDQMMLRRIAVFVTGTCRGMTTSSSAAAREGGRRPPLIVLRQSTIDCGRSFATSSATTTSLVVAKTPAQIERRKRYVKRRRKKSNGPTTTTTSSSPPPPLQSSATGGRPIMTTEMLDRILDEGDGMIMRPSSIILTRDTCDMAKQIVHHARAKMLFTQRYEHSSMGSKSRDGVFVATLRTTIDKACLSKDYRDNLDGGTSSSSSHATTFVDDDDGHTMVVNDSANDTTIEFVNAGAARTKKRAETYACIDLILQLSEIYIDMVNNPPDLAGKRKAIVEERFASDVKYAKMILEALGVSRLIFDTRPCVEGTTANQQQQQKQAAGGFISTVRFYCRGVPITETSNIDDDDGGGGRNKAEAEGRALLTATACESVLDNFVGRRTMERIRSAITNSPSGHIATLHVAPLPDDALQVLTNALGTRSVRLERMTRHEDDMARRMNEFYERNVMYTNNNHRRRLGREELQSSSSNEEAVRINDVFREEEKSRLDEAICNPDGKEGIMKTMRESLPILAIRQDLIDSLKSRPVVVVSGGTGSGKSTQCPQYILEDAIANGRGAETRIVVTQPRRIAAISVSERIASERNETIGNSVGFAVRHSARTPRSAASIEFVTTGILLRRLINDPTLDGVSHVMIDEVHERDIDTDYLLILLRDLLTLRPELRVVLMSATLDADSFQEYFSLGPDDSVPVMSVPAKPRHHVDVIHLEDISGEGSMGNDIPTDIQDVAQSLLRLHDQRLQFELEEAVAEELATSRLNASDGDDDINSSDSDSDNDELSQSSLRVKVLRRAVTLRRRSNAKGDILLPSNTIGRQQSRGDKKDIGEITTKLLAMMARYAAEVELGLGRSGSILCFLPGLDEIKHALSILEDDTVHSLRNKLKIIPLHSSIPQDEQQQIFQAAVDGTVKIILATNIAESSVTIDDVLAIVDSGLVRESHWDAEKSMSSMLTMPTSKASATQRLGRAGRVAEGKCYRLYSLGQYEAMKDRPLPEIQRSALESICLNTCSMTNEKVATFLSRALDPPKEEAVAYSMERLQKLGAISVESTVETLTALGMCLSRLPLDPAIGRMLIMGCVMQCLDPILTAAACFSSRDIFFTPPGFRDEQRKIRGEFCQSSDTLAAVRAYEEYNDILRDEGWNVARHWASENFISVTTLTSVHSIRNQLISELNRIGFIPNSDIEYSRGRNKVLRPDATVNQNARIDLLSSAVWACGAPDNLAARQQLGSFGSMRTRNEDKVCLHPSSVAFYRKPPKHSSRLPPWFSYREMVLSSQVFLRGCTALSPEQIMLFGGYDYDIAKRQLDDWVIVESQCDETLNALSAARHEINAALELSVINPRKPLPYSHRAIIDAICDCFDVLEATENE